MSVLPVDSLETPRFVGVPTFMRLPQATTPRRPRRRDHRAAVRFRRALPHRRALRAERGARHVGDAAADQSLSRRHQRVRASVRVADAGDAAVVPGYHRGDRWRASRPRCGGSSRPASRRSASAATIRSRSPSSRAVASRHGPLALVHFDAHSDTWDKYFAGKKYSAGTPFRRAVEEGIVAPGPLDPGRHARLAVLAATTSASRATSATRSSPPTRCSRSACPRSPTGSQRGPRDGRSSSASTSTFVDPAAAPGVVTPEAGGPSARETLTLLRRL